MAYVLGFIYADGSIYKSARGSYLVVTSVDRQIIFGIKKWLGSRHKIIVTESNWPNGKLRYFLRIGNKNLYESLVKLGLYPNKSLTVRLPLIPKTFFRDFVRGYFDGDGCAYLYRSKGKDRKLIVRKLSIIFTSGSKKFLEDILMTLKRSLDLRQDKIYKSHRSFQLRFATKDSVKLFKFMYRNTASEFFFRRKFVVFSSYFRLRPGKIDKEIANILGL